MNDVKVPLALATQNLATIMEAIDEGRLDEAITKLFNDARLDVAAAVDRRICFFDIGERSVETLRDISRKYAQAAAQLANALETVEKNTIEIMKANPDAPYKGDLGRFQIQKNGSPAVNILFETGKKSISNIIDAQDIEKYEIDNKFYDVHTHYALVMERIKKAIEAGENIPWAYLSKGEHLRRYKKGNKDGSRSDE